MALPSLAGHALVGGTALALRFGHRVSVYLDLFGAELDEDLLIGELSKEFGEEFKYEPGRGRSIGLFCYIEGVKVDIVRYPHPLIRPMEVVDGIRMSSTADIAAMKVQALLGRGKKKDFWDMAMLLKHHGVGEIIAWHGEKYPSQILAISLPAALTYFTDAEDSEDPISLHGQTWAGVKASISEAVSDFLR